MKFRFPEFALYHHKTTIGTCMEYCCHVTSGLVSLMPLDKLQKRICRTAGFSLAASFETLAHCRNVVGLSLFYRY